MDQQGLFCARLVVDAVVGGKISLWWHDGICRLAVLLFKETVACERAY